jgi:anthranilate synthase/aminodeoxychorismate synthase-like glutamine amidotransferase
LVLLIDNYDSFTYNLYDYIKQLGKDCIVVRNDEMTIEEIDQLVFSSVVISPGPCRPVDSGITNDVIAKYYQTKPILGVCLGHQALGEFFGASLVLAEKPMHGKTSVIQLSNHPIFKGLGSTTEVMRYHSLVLKNIQPPLQVVAQTQSGEVMAIAHQSLPLVGIQFHPESILTTHGLKMLENWFE